MAGAARTHAYGKKAQCSLAEEDDFDIVPDEDEARPRSTWLWAGITAVVALFAFGVGAAFMIMSDRMGSNAPPPTPTPALAVVGPTQVAAITATLMVTSSAQVTSTGAPTATLTPTLTPTPSATATPACNTPVEGQFVTYYDQAALGCATNDAAIVWAAYQPFERGSMLWRSDRDTSYVFYASGAWRPITEGWDGSAPRDRGAAPPGLQAPQRGFGYVWSYSDELFNGLGWARDQERGFCALVQEFERGFILRSSDVVSCTPDNLYNHATAGDWAVLLLVAVENGGWGNSPASPASVTTPVPTATLASNAPPASTTSRPAPNGIFDAANATGYTIDGTFEDWPGVWLPMNTIILGASNHDGPGDLSGNFQVGWNANGLMLAIRVNDEAYRPGPSGSDLWQGDSIEIQFDRQLSEDYNSTDADADDYQVGIAFNNDRTATRAYLWLPLARESELALPSAAVASAQGYQLEVLIPWYVFDIDTPATDRAYGFNISVNDNDSDGTSQETVISASPARTTHDNPTEWSTLRLMR